MDTEMEREEMAAVGAKKPGLPVRVWRFYADGFRSMTIGRYLWAIILIKLFILFAVMRLFFFPTYCRAIMKMMRTAPRQSAPILSMTVERFPTVVCSYDR